MVNIFRHSHLTYNHVTTQKRSHLAVTVFLDIEIIERHPLTRGEWSIKGGDIVQGIKHDTATLLVAVGEW